MTLVKYHNFMSAKTVHQPQHKILEDDSVRLIYLKATDEINMVRLGSII